MIHVTRIGFGELERRPGDKSGVESILQTVLRRMEAGGHLLLSVSVVQPSHNEEEMAEAYVVTATLPEPPPESPQSKIIPGN